MRKKLFAAKKHIKHKLNLPFRSASFALFCGHLFSSTAFCFRFNFPTGKLRAIMNRVNTAVRLERRLS